MSADYLDYLMDDLWADEAQDRALDDAAAEWAQHRAEAVAFLGRRLRNVGADFAGWTYADRVSAENALEWMAGLRDTLTDREWEILEMIQAGTPTDQGRRVYPWETEPAPLRDVPRRAYGERRARRHRPDRCLPNRRAANAPPCGLVLRPRAMAVALTVTDHRGPP